MICSKNNKGQATLEYVLILIVSVVVLGALLLKLNQGFQTWGRSIVGISEDGEDGQIACYLQTGLLPGQTRSSSGGLCSGATAIDFSYSSGGSSSSYSSGGSSSSYSSGGSSSSYSSGGSSSGGSSSGGSSSSYSSSASSGGGETSAGSSSDSGGTTAGSMHKTFKADATGNKKLNTKDYGENNKSNSSSSSNSASSSDASSSATPGSQGAIFSIENSGFDGVNANQSSIKKDKNSRSGRRKKRSHSRQSRKTRSDQEHYTGERHKSLNMQGYMLGERQEEEEKRNTPIAVSKTVTKKASSSVKEKNSYLTNKSIQKKSIIEDDDTQWSFGKIFRIFVFMLILGVLIFIIISQTTQASKDVK